METSVRQVDYTNMSKVDRGVAAGIVKLADEADPPKWSGQKAAAKYRNVGKTDRAGEPWQVIVFANAED